MKAELSDLFREIKEQNLGRAALEKYEQQLAALYAEIMLDIGSLKKERALYFLARQRPETTDISIRRTFDGTPSGQRLIELEVSVKAVARMYSSVRSRIYQHL